MFYNATYEDMFKKMKQDMYMFRVQNCWHGQKETYGNNVLLH